MTSPSHCWDGHPICHACNYLQLLESRDSRRRGRKEQETGREAGSKKVLGVAPPSAQGPSVLPAGTGDRAQAWLCLFTFMLNIPTRKRSRKMIGEGWLDT